MVESEEDWPDTSIRCGGIDEKNTIYTDDRKLIIPVHVRPVPEGQWLRVFNGIAKERGLSFPVGDGLQSGQATMIMRDVTPDQGTVVQFHHTLRAVIDETNRRYDAERRNALEQVAMRRKQEASAREQLRLAAQTIRDRLGPAEE